jgi:hydantoinase/carbamoylase family amidase
MDFRGYSMIGHFGEHWLKRLNPESTLTSAGGYTRLGFTQAEEEASKAFCSIAEQELGLSVRTDPAGNVIARWEGKERFPAIVIGSHLDTVVNGGAYDGAAGILSGLLAVKILKDQQFTPLFPIEIISFSCEESSRFGVSTIGSKSMTGLFSVEQYRTLSDRNGISLEKAVLERGLRLENFPQAKRKQEDILVFCELHIEQGPTLETNREQIGIVTAIAAPTRLRVRLSSGSGHTGTTPMEIRYERDALLLASKLIQAVHDQTQSFPDVVATVSTMDIQPNAMNVIPSQVNMGIDIRSSDYRTKNTYVQQLIKTFKTIVSVGGKMEIDILVDDHPTTLSTQVCGSLEQAVRKLGYRYRYMTSGAGHDAMNMAKVWPSALLFIPCHNGQSHHPDERANIEDIMNGAEVLAEWIKLYKGGINKK